MDQDSAQVKRVAGLILAAGKSERMGSPKPLLQIGGRSFLEHIAAQIRKSELCDFRIVLGHNANEIMNTVPHFHPYIIINPHYDEGQLSSLIKGLQTLDGSKTEGVMLFLVDHPFVTCQTINLLLRQFSQQPLPVVIPTFAGRRGHPLIFGRQLFSELLNAPLDQGAAFVVRSHQSEIFHVEVQDPGVLLDIDTPEAYQEYVVGQGMGGAP